MLKRLLTAAHPLATEFVKQFHAAALARPPTRPPLMHTATTKDGRQQHCTPATPWPRADLVGWRAGWHAAARRFHHQPGHPLQRGRRSPRSSAAPGAPPSQAGTIAGRLASGCMHCRHHCTARDARCITSPALLLHPPFRRFKFATSPCPTPCPLLLLCAPPPLLLLIPTVTRPPLLVSCACPSCRPLQAQSHSRLIAATLLPVQSTSFEAHYQLCRVMLHGRSHRAHYL
jgi:hypothetical protein